MPLPSTDDTEWLFAAALLHTTQTPVVLVVPDRSQSGSDSSASDWCLRRL